jgi:hypothetical protein
MSKGHAFFVHRADALAGRRMATARIELSKFRKPTAISAKDYPRVISSL